MAGERSPSNKGINKNKTNGSSYSTGRNPGGMVAGLTADTTYGEGKEIKDQVAATGGLPQVGNLPPVQTQPQINLSQVDAFAGTERPNEPVTSGLSFGAGYSPQQSVEEDPDMLLRVLYSVYPDPIFIQMMNRQDLG